MSHVHKDQIQDRLDVMNFLNEATSRFPKAISFASGRPLGSLFDLDRALQAIPTFLQYYSEKNGTSLRKSKELLAQYGPTNGIIADLIAKHLSSDRNITCSEEQILITSGCQEGIDLCIKYLCPNKSDAILVRNPTYIGVTGASFFSNANLFYFKESDQKNIGESLLETILEAKRLGYRPAALYLTPDFDNPTGETLSLETRKNLLSICVEHSVVILEDDPYSMFRYSGEKIPAIFSLNEGGNVIYLGTFSKTIFPTLRVGFAVFPSRMAATGSLKDILQQKSFSSLNTSQISQAMVGGILVEERFTLSNRIKPYVERYRTNRDALLSNLIASNNKRGFGMSISNPQGGFFLTVDTRRCFRAQEVQDCAEIFGVTLLPLSAFSFNNTNDNVVRFAFSNVTLDEIAEGVTRFVRYLERVN